MEELKEIFSNDWTRCANYRDLQDMKYLDMVIKETLRLYPSVPMIGRKVDEDNKFFDGILPASLNIGIFVYALHRNATFFPDPEKFDPERFNNENCSNRPPFCYIPFSAGSRNCIGQKFAILELKSIISQILRHFQLLPAYPEHHLQLAAEVIMRSRNGIHVRLKPLNIEKLNDK